MMRKPFYVILGFVDLLAAKRPLASGRILFLMSFLCFSFYNVHLLIDLFLTLNLGVRINNVFFYFLNDIGPFIDSPKKRGLSVFLVLILFVACLSWILFKSYFKKFETHKLSIASVGSAIATFVIALLLNSVPPYNIKNYSASPVFAHHHDLMAKFVGQDHSEPDKISKNEILSTLSCCDTEEFSLISPEFPLLKMIKGISGLNHAMGASLVRENHDRTVFFNNPFELIYRGLRKGSMKFIYSKQEQGTIAELYDLESDPAEKENLLTDFDSIRGYFEKAEKVHRVCSTLYDRRNFAPSD